MHISYIFITVEKTKSLYAYNGCLSQEIVRSSDVFIKYTFDKQVWMVVEIMSLKNCSHCTSIVYVVSLMYIFVKGLIIFEQVGILQVKVATNTTQV